MSDLNRYCVELKLTYAYEIIATSPEQAEEIARRRFDHPNFTNYTVDNVKVELKGKEDV